ncbi:MAG: hypothetical protein AAGA58_08175 [Verrucomicrobiota bacterium]
MSKRYALEFPEAFAIAKQEGIDLSLLESNLRKTPDERAGSHDRALNLMLELRRSEHGHGD